MHLVDDVPNATTSPCMQTQHEEAVRQHDRGNLEDRLFDVGLFATSFGRSDMSWVRCRLPLIFDLCPELYSQTKPC